jgi:hypothetical protein
MRKRDAAGKSTLHERDVPSRVRFLRAGKFPRFGDPFTDISEDMIVKVGMGNFRAQTRDTGLIDAENHHIKLIPGMANIGLTIIEGPPPLVEKSGEPD